MELFTRQAAVALFFGLFATSTQAKEFSYLETFDDDATFSAGATLPDGWLGDASAVPVQRYEGAYLGSGNHSGSYVLGTMASSSMGRDSWVYTRKLTLKAGVAYTVSYWLHMPGGVAPAAYNNNVALYVGTDQTREAATTLVGETQRVDTADIHLHPRSRRRICFRDKHNQSALQLGLRSTRRL